MKTKTLLASILTLPLLASACDLSDVPGYEPPEVVDDQFKPAPPPPPGPSTDSAIPTVDIIKNNTPPPPPPVTPPALKNRD